MEAAAAAVPVLAGPSLKRYERCLQVALAEEPFDIAEAEACLNEALQAVA
jgi:3-deoxy-D-manno-octulosonic-acid transferase